MLMVLRKMLILNPLGSYILVSIPQKFSESRHLLLLFVPDSSLLLKHSVDLFNLPFALPIWTADPLFLNIEHVNLLCPGL